MTLKSATVSTLESLFSLPDWMPKGYQQRGIEFLDERPFAALFLKPGLGKTSLSLNEIKKKKLKALVIAPIRVCYEVWPKEIDKWENFKSLRYTILHGKDKDEKLDLDADVYLINPEGLKWFFERAGLQRTGVNALYVDESTKFKNPSSQRFKILKPFLPYFKIRRILTGTPSPRSLLDLFSQAYIVDRGAALGQYITHYRNKYFYQSGYGGYTWLPFPNAEEEISKALEPMAFALDGEEELTLPETIFNSISVTLPPQAMTLYKQMEDDLITEMNKTVIESVNAAVAQGRCRQITGGAIYDAEKKWHEIHTAKLDALVDLLEQLNGQPVMVLFEFKHERDRISAKLLSEKILFNVIDGDTPPSATAAICKDWNAGVLPVLLANPASISHGLNLQGGGQDMIWFTLPWNLEYFEQTIRRLKRQGSRHESIFVHIIEARDTIDEKVARVLSSKEATQSNLFTLLRKQYA